MTSSTPHDTFDVVVVGARCAGAATAMLLARAGYNVALVDRADLPSDTLSTHSLPRGGVVQLARWGLLDEVLDSGAPPIRAAWFHTYGPDAAPSARHVVKDRAGVDHMLAPRRYVLDRILANAAERAGATLMTRTTVTGLVHEGGRVRGIRVGERILRARLVIGADGLRSRVAQWTGAATRASYAPSGALFYTYVDGVPWDGFEFHIAPGAFAGVFPTHDGAACVWLTRPVDLSADLISAGADRLAAWSQALRETVPGLAATVESGRIVAPLRGTVGLPTYVRQVAGPGWALVGDAAYHRDPITGHGITDAFRDAELLAEAASRFLDGGSESDAMAGYRCRRDESIVELLRITLALGEYPEVPRFSELQIELARALDAEALQLIRLAPAA